MEEKLIVLGTGNAMVTNYYNTCFAIQKEKEYFLVDAGGGNQILGILKELDIKINAIKNIFVTHSHPDHMLGIIWMIRKIATMMQNNQYEGDCHIYGHDVVIQNIKVICELTLEKKNINVFDHKIIFHIVQNGEEAKILENKVTFFDIYSTKEKQFGFSMILENGKKLTCLGDEPYNENCEEYIKNADWMLSEAFCMYHDRELYKPYEKHHSTVKDAAEIAERLQIPNLVLWHTEEDHLKNRKELYTAEAKEYYNGNVYIPEDREIIML